MKPLRPEQLSPLASAMYQDIVDGPRGADAKQRSRLVYEDGSLKGPFDALLRVPEVGDPLQKLGAALRFRGQLPPPLREITALLVSTQLNCSREVSVHKKILLDLGLPSSFVEDLSRGVRPAIEEGTHKLVYDACCELSAQGRLSERTFAELEHQLGLAPTIELIVLVGYYTLICYVTGAVGLEIE